MSSNSRSPKNDLTKYFLASSDCDSEGPEQARKFLESEGVKVDQMLEDGLKRIKKIQFQLKAEETKKGMRAFDEVRINVIQWVESLISQPGFSFINCVQQENIVVNFRSVESMSEEDKKEILVKHFTLKRLNDESENPSGV
jgi:hypothetical protein